MTDRVVVVQHKRSGRVIAVFGSKERYDNWCDDCGYSESALQTRWCNVRGADE